MSIILAIMGREPAGYRATALAFSLSLLAMALLSGRPDLVVLHLGLATLHILRLRAEDDLGGHALLSATRDSR